MTPHQNEQSLYPPAVSLIFEARNGPWTSKSYLKRYLASNGLGWNQKKLTVNNGQASGFRGKIMLKRGLLNKLPYTCNGYYLVNDNNDVRLVKRRNSSFLYLYAFLTWHKSFNFESFRCWGEVVVPSEPPKKDRIRKRAKYWTMAVRVEREHSVYWNQCYVLIIL